jgi:glycosyltransferase involved in cell wall biosynthesis
LIRDTGIDKHTIELGSVAEWLPDLYALSDIYCTPSVMEGFGMTAEEAAATGLPVIASDRVPFALEYLLGPSPTDVALGDKVIVKQGKGGIVVPADNEEGFTQAMLLLMKDKNLRTTMGRAAYDITIPYFSWDQMVKRFLRAIGFA